MSRLPVCLHSVSNRVTTMSSVSVKISKDLSPRIANHLELFYEIVRVFQRLVPPLQVLINMHKCHQKLCQSIIRGAEKALIFIKVVEGALLLKHDQARKERICAELGYAGENLGGKQSAVEKVSDAAIRYPELVGLEAELKSRFEGIGRVQRELADLCQEIEQRSRDLFENDPTRNQNTRVMEAFALGCVIVVFLLILKLRVFYWGPFIFTPLACGCFVSVFSCCKYFLNAADVNRERVTLQKLVDASSELKSLCNLELHTYDSELGAMIRETALVSEVKMSLDQFFTAQHMERQTEEKKDELKKIIHSLEEYM